MQFLLIIGCLWSLMPSTRAQSVVWINAPFADHSQNYSFGRDTVTFVPSSTILGLVYAPDLELSNPKIELDCINSFGEQASSKFYVKPLSFEVLNWHPQLKRSFAAMLQSKHWYYFDITSFPSVVEAKDGVNFLSILFKEAVKSEDKQVLAEIGYKLSSASNYRYCSIDFRKDAGYFSYLWERLQYYAIVINQYQQLKFQSDSLLQECSEYGIAQIEQWAMQVMQLEDRLQGADLALFKEVEKLKIITETIADSVSKEHKIRLRSLLLLDVALLEADQEIQKKQLLARRSALLKELAFYPDLEQILWSYDVQQKEVNGEALSEQQTERMLRDVRMRFAPFEAVYQRLTIIGREKEVLANLLKVFD